MHIHTYIHTYVCIYIDRQYVFIRALTCSYYIYLSVLLVVMKFGIENLPKVADSNCTTQTIFVYKDLNIYLNI